MSTIIRFACTCILCLILPGFAIGDELRIHLISGSAEYESEPSLRDLQRELEENYAGITVTASWGRDAGDHLPGIGDLADADLLMVFTRRMELPEEQLDIIRGHVEAEKPVIGIRTASHAFQDFLEMDSEVFGGDYSGHGDDESVKVTITEGAEDHPVLKNVEPWSRPGKIYHNPDLGPRTTRLLDGTGLDSEISEPLAWTNRYGERGRAFYTSMGMPGDFENANFRKLLFNAIEWTAGRELIYSNQAMSTTPNLIDLEKPHVLAAADLYLLEPPVTITAFPAERSAGGKHDYYSEGDYWWPDPDSEDGLPYINRDGQTNPANFVDHRLVMRRLSLHVPALAAAYVITGNERYAGHAAAHLEAWFVEESTRMNPSLKYSQAIPGRVEGRGIGIIDTLHLAEVARAAKVLIEKDALPEAVREGVKKWFESYHNWLNTHEYGLDERDHPNNHSTAWLLQAAAFADLVGDAQKLEEYRKRFREIIIPGQMAEDGSFPRELGRTKPYGYSLFNWDLLGALAQLLSTPEEDLWEFTTEDGRGMKPAMDFIHPFIEDKSKWPYDPDVMYHDEWPVRHPTLLFAGLAYENEAYIDTWSGLPASSNVHEVIRNFPVRQPLLWVE